MSAEKSDSSLFREVFQKPLFLIWTMVLPQILLLVLNFRAWNLVSGEMSEIQKGRALSVGIFEIALLAAGCFTFAILQMRRQKVGWVIPAAMILAHVGYLWSFTSVLGELIPASVATWILPSDELLYYQYALIMPALFYAGFRLASFETSLHRVADLGISAGVLILMPIAWFVAVSLTHALPHGFQPPVVLGMIFFVGSTAIALLAFLRALLIVYRWIENLSRGRWILLAVAGLLAPLGGLLLNITIPFPYDFQDPWVYVLTVLNGLILLTPTPAQPVGRWATWYLRGLAYPFTLYFFVVFLPFLPLSLLAMIACGAGCLILAPTLLFVVQTRRLLDEGRDHISQRGWLLPLGLFLAGLLTVPAAYTVRALGDRQALLSAADAVYNRDPDVSRISFRPASALRALERLRNQKDGIQIPFISDYYNQLVFDGMVLPDHKIDRIEQVLSGAKRTEKQRNSRWDYVDFFGTRGRRDARGWSPAMPPRNVALSAVDLVAERVGDVVKARTRLRMRNGAGNMAEFVTEIDVPTGVLVTGYWLNMETNRVPGRIFEKKAALWVYHMIRDTTRRDPGLLVYQDPNRLKLSVFPFQSGEERVTEIEFTFPAVLDPEIRIGSRSLRLNPGVVAAADPIRFPADNGDTMVIPRSVLQTLPSARRTPYLHFILDCSVNADKEFAQYPERIRREVAKFPEAKFCRVSAANYEVVDLTPDFISAADAVSLVASARDRPLPFRGAFCPEFALQHALRDFEKRSASPKNAEPLVPVFILIQADTTTPVAVGDLSVLAEAVLDVPAWYTTRADGRLDVWTFRGTTNGVVDRPQLPDPAVVLRHGTQTITRCQDRDAVVAFRSVGGLPTVLDPAARQFVEMTNALQSAHDGGYGAGMSLWLDWRDHAARPSVADKGLAGLVARSWKSNVLIPATSFIVVENEAQWKVLALKEKQALSANAALEFDEFKESPEPSFWWLVPVVLALPWLRKVRPVRTA